jgi:hypothetical protein
MQQPSLSKCFIVIALFLLFNPLKSKAYSVLTHEAVIDASWVPTICPLLKERFPMATDSELRVAHSYAYGGCLVADMGYCPFGSEYFTNLAHYVCTGDFITTLIEQAHTLNEYAFAIGAISHYMADKYGHSISTNHVVPLVYPKLKKKYGDVVTYDENPIAHSRTELSFDVLQVARGNYVTQSYHDFIGFNMAVPLLERAFLKVYGEDLNDVFGDFDTALGTFRWAVKSLMPSVTRAAWVLKKDDIQKMNKTATSKTFSYRMRRREYQLEYGKKRQTPTFKDHHLALLISLLPKIGPFKTLKFKDPGPEGEKLFIKSFNAVLLNYSIALKQMHDGTLVLPNINFDTGDPTKIGDYPLADQTYNELLDNLKDTKFNNLSAKLKNNIVSFYNSADSSMMVKEDPQEWKKAYVVLQNIKKVQPVKLDSLKNSRGINYRMITQ